MCVGVHVCVCACGWGGAALLCPGNPPPRCPKPSLGGGDNKNRDPPLLSKLWPGEGGNWHRAPPQKAGDGDRDPRARGWGGGTRTKEGGTSGWRRAAVLDGWGGSCADPPRAGWRLRRLSGLSTRGEGRGHICSVPPPALGGLQWKGVEEVTWRGGQWEPLCWVVI